MKRVQKSSCVEVLVEATAPQVWAVIADVTRVGEWSHECCEAWWLDADGRARPAARFRGRSVAGRLRWGRTCELLTVDPPRELSWRTVPTALTPDSTRWIIRLDPTDEARTVVRQSFEVIRAPRLLDPLYARLVPGHQDRDRRLTEDLVRLGAVAAQGAGP